MIATPDPAERRPRDGGRGSVIGRAQRADLPRICAVRHAAFARHAPAAYSPEQVDTLLHDVDEDELVALIDGGRLFAARVGDLVVGCAGWQDGRVRHVYVDPGYGRRGIGSALLNRVESDFLRRTGQRRLGVHVALHAEPFYRANGYRVLGRGRAWDDSTYLRMVKEMRSPSPPAGGDERT